MAIQGWIVAAAFLGLIALVLSRVVMMRRRGIAAFLFGATHKSDAVIIPCVLAVIYCLIAPAFGWPIWAPLVAGFWQATWPGWIGIAFCFAALAGLAWTLVSFGDSFRVGIDDAKPGDLVTTGAFAYSRNPIYVCMALFLIGLFLTVPNLITALVVVAFGAIVHRQVLREERFLTQHHGEAFEAYRQTVRRYL
ncbi:MAG: isoprenylcysteine carboxylmethyltransferase family protein [Propionibacteriaceae bacterium]|jgi:protein-S-isoprenylcysteine O-methyltransferase Ste14|nr:isoprenylcysteine carboxylmethyltransferase family protein [Propionibacteriaceae bacterium]